MKKSIRLYFKLLGVSLRSQMQHRASFFMLTAAYFLSTFAAIIGIWVLFDRFKQVQGWTLEELGLLYGIIQMGFSIAEAFSRGFDSFGVMIRKGDFDRILLRPCGTLFQVATSEIQPMRLGRFLQGAIVLGWSYSELGFPFFSVSSAVISFAIIGTASLFTGLFVIQGTLSFWTTETLELMNITTYGGMEIGQYPMTIYKQSFRNFFTFVIPISSVAFYPVAALLKETSSSFFVGVSAPFLGVVFLWLACQFWKLGVRRYHSTGS